MKRLLLSLSFVILQLSLSVAQESLPQKSIYIPEDLRQMDLACDTSLWSWKRSAQTQDLIVMWQRGFGGDLQSPPDLDGHPMSFNLSVLMERLQSFYTFFRDTLGFVSDSSQFIVNSYDYPAAPTAEQRGEGDARLGNHNYKLSTINYNPSKSDRYKMMVMVMYSLDGTAYGGTYDNFIGGLWVAPNRIQDKTMNCMAHELGHSFQSQIMADSVGQCWGGSPFFEMASQWMLWQVNPWWLRDENYHFEAFRKLTHKAFLHMENIYHSPYVLQWWSDLHGRRSIAELFRQGRVGEDPVITYKRLYGLSQQQFCDEMLLGYQHLVNFDFQHARQETRPYACTFTTRLQQLPGGWQQPQDVPEAYGFNAILLDSLTNLSHRSFTLQLRGDHVRHAFVGVTTDGPSLYSPIGATTFRVPRGQQLRHLYLVVMGAPAEHQQLYRFTDEGPQPGAQPQLFPYQFRVK